MNKNTWIALGVEATGCAAIAMSLRELGMEEAAFPYAQLGAVLRGLSLSGKAGNIAAWALLILTAGLPLIWLIYARTRRAWRAEDGLPALIACLLVPALYGAVNPEWLAGALGFPEASLAVAAVAACLNALWIAYIALRVLRRTRENGEQALLKDMDAILLAGMAALVAAAFCGVPAALRGQLAQVAAGNTGGLGMTKTLIFWGALVDEIPLMGDFWALAEARRLICARRAGESGLREAEALARRSSLAIAATVLSQAALNLVVALTARWNRAIQLNVNLPVGELTIALALMLAARGIAENKRLRDDSALFI